MHNNNKYDINTLYCSSTYGNENYYNNDGYFVHFRFGSTNDYKWPLYYIWASSNVGEILFGSHLAGGMCVYIICIVSISAVVDTTTLHLYIDDAYRTCLTLTHPRHVIF